MTIAQQKAFQQIMEGVAIEATKEDLEKALKDFDKPVWTIEKFNNNLYYIYKNERPILPVWDIHKQFQENYSQLIYKIANAMGILASKEEILDREITKDYVYLNNQYRQFMIDDSGLYVFNCSIKSGFGDGVADLINNSVLMKEFE